ncbi:MAG: SSU ribosomal protein S16p, partial [uncultured Solirubrobacteraceae bacterium]
GSTTPAHPRGWPQGSGVARRRRRPALAARRSRHRDGRPVQRADRAVHDRPQGGPHRGVAVQGRPADRPGQAAHAGARQGEGCRRRGKL